MTGRPAVPLGRRSHDSRPPSPTSNNHIGDRRRTSSDATPTTPHLPDFSYVFEPSASVAALDPHHPSRRLGFFGDILSSSASLTRETGSAVVSAIRSGTPIPPQLLPPRTHSRTGSSLPALAVPRDSSSSANMSSSSGASPANNIKSHTSPSKPTSGRTYDSKLVSREMHRLGNLAHLPIAIAAAASAASLALPAPSITAPSMSSTSSDNPWAQLHVYVLPLFNGEPLRIPIEDLNALVKRHIQTVISSSPSKAVATLEHDAAELIASGMITLNAKLAGLEDDKLVARVVEIWTFFWDQVLPYIEGALLPLQTNSLLLSLYRTPKTHRTSSPTRQNGKGSMSSFSSLQSGSQIDVRTVALRSFRDKVVLPLFPKLNARLTMPKKDTFVEYQQPRLQQMLLVLVSQCRTRPTTVSLTSPAPSPTAGEVAVNQLLRTIRAPLTQLHRNDVAAGLMHSSSMRSKRTPSFLSGGVPRDRRGRIGQKPGWIRAEKILSRGGGEAGMAVSFDVVDDEDGDGGETPRNGGGHLEREKEREREREFLESLRSPDPEGTNARASFGGWGLGGGGNEEQAKPEEDDEDEPPLNWDDAQAVVERMVGMKPNDPSNPEIRRRMT